MVRQRLLLDAQKKKTDQRKPKDNCNGKDGVDEKDGVADKDKEKEKDWTDSPLVQKTLVCIVMIEFLCIWYFAQTEETYLRVEIQETVARNINMTKQINDLRRLNEKLQRKINASIYAQQVVKEQNRSQEIEMSLQEQKRLMDQLQSNATDAKDKREKLDQKFSKEKTKQITMLAELTAQKIARVETASVLHALNSSVFVWNVASLLDNRSYNRGEALSSPLFALGENVGLTMRLYFLPAGLKSAKDGYCSLYVSGPVGWKIKARLSVDNVSLVVDTEEFTTRRPYWGVLNFCRISMGPKFSNVSIEVLSATRLSGDQFARWLAGERSSFIWNVSNFTAGAARGMRFTSPSFMLRGVPGLKLDFYPAGQRDSEPGTCSLFLLVPTEPAWTLRARFFVGNASKTFGLRDFVDGFSKAYEISWGFNNFPAPSNWESTIIGVELMYAKPFGELVRQLTLSAEHVYMQNRLSVNTMASGGLVIRSKEQTEYNTAKGSFAKQMDSSDSDYDNYDFDTDQEVDKAKAEREGLSDQINGMVSVDDLVQRQLDVAARKNITMTESKIQELRDYYTSYVRRTLPQLQAKNDYIA